MLYVSDLPFGVPSESVGGLSTPHRSVESSEGERTFLACDSIHAYKRPRRAFGDAFGSDPAAGPTLDSALPAGYPSGQRGPAVNRLAQSFAGSNPAPAIRGAGVWSAGGAGGAGQADLRRVLVAHPIQDRTDDELHELARGALDEVLAGLSS